MTTVRDRFAGFRSRQPDTAATVVSLAVLLTGVVTLTPAWWWHRLTAMITGPGWRWLPILSAEFSGGGVNLGAPKAWSVPPTRIDDSAQGVWWPSAEHLANITRENGTAPEPRTVT